MVVLFGIVGIVFIIAFFFIVFGIYLLIDNKNDVLKYTVREILQIALMILCGLIINIFIILWLIII